MLHVKEIKTNMQWSCESHNPPPQPTHLLPATGNIHPDPTIYKYVSHHAPEAGFDALHFGALLSLNCCCE